MQHGRHADRFANLAQPGSGDFQRRLGGHIALLGAGDGAAAGLDHQDVVAEELGHDVAVKRVVGHPRVIAADVGDDAADTALHDGIVERTEGSPVNTTQGVVDVFVREAGNDVALDIGNGNLAALGEAIAGYAHDLFGCRPGQ